MILPEPFIKSLIDRFNGPDVVGISLTGSYARGQPGPYSDIDLHIYVKNVPETKYYLQVLEGHLISVSFNTIEAERANLSRPGPALSAVPGLRQSLILLDRDGSLAALEQSALEFEWSSLQSLADESAVEELMGFAEEAHKILNGLQAEQESTVLYALSGLVHGLCRAVAVQRGLLMETENQFFDIIQDSVGRNTAWTRALRLSLGADISTEPIPPYKSRGIACLVLYRETACLFTSIITEKHREVIETTLKLIDTAKIITR